MEEEKLNVQPITAGEHARGCGMFFDGIMGDVPTVNHLDDPGLNAAVAGAVKRPLGDRWAWSRKDSTIDITTLVSTTLALYGFLRKRLEGQPCLAGRFTATWTNRTKSPASMRPDYPLLTTRIYDTYS